MTKKLNSSIRRIYKKYRLNAQDRKRLLGSFETVVAAVVKISKDKYWEEACRRPRFK